MKINKIWVLLLILIMISAGLTAILYGAVKVKSYKEYRLYITVTPDTALGLNTDVSEAKIYFGALPAGSSSTRTLNITNNEDNPLTAYLYSSGDIDEWIEAPPILEIPAADLVTFNVTAVVPADAKPGDYVGKLKIRLLKT